MININIHTGKAGPGGKDSPAWEPDAITKVHNDKCKARLLKVLWGRAPLLRKGFPKFSFLFLIGEGEILPLKFSVAILRSVQIGLKEPKLEPN